MTSALGWKQLREQTEFNHSPCNTQASEARNELESFIFFLLPAAAVPLEALMLKTSIRLGRSIDPVRKTSACLGSNAGLRMRGVLSDDEASRQGHA
jgi:hypothetical protein